MKLSNKKTGEVREGRVEVIFQNNDKFPNPLERHAVESFAELNDEWEEVEEPLIKDPKIRKAVRAWYELFDESQLGQFEDGKYIAVGYREFVLQTLDTSLTYTFELPFIDGMQSLKQRWG